MWVFETMMPKPRIKHRFHKEDRGFDASTTAHLMKNRGDADPYTRFLSTFSANASRQLDILWHDGNTLGVDCAQVGVFEQADQVGFRSFLEGTDGGALESEISLEILCDFTNKTLEGEFPDEQLGRLLVATNLSKSHSTGTISVGLLHSSGGGSRLTSGFGGQLLPRSLSSGGFTGSLLRTGHFALIQTDR